MKPYKHALISKKKFGGSLEDYLPIHEFFDSTKQNIPDMRHRMILHNSFGIFLAAKVFGDLITNSEGKLVSVRDIGEDHVLQDLGFIPTVEKCFEGLALSAWMGGKPSITRIIKLNEVENVD